MKFKGLIPKGTERKVNGLLLIKFIINNLQYPLSVSQYLKWHLNLIWVVKNFSKRDMSMSKENMSYEIFKYVTFLGVYFINIIILIFLIKWG